MNLPSVLQICFLHWQHLWAVHTGNSNSMHSNLMWIFLIPHSHFCKQDIAWPLKSHQCIHLHYECNITAEHNWVTKKFLKQALWRFVPSQTDSFCLVQWPLQTPSCPCTLQSRPYCCPVQQTALWPHQSTCSKERPQYNREDNRTENTSIDFLMFSFIWMWWTVYSLYCRVFIWGC